ncbi:MAG: TRAP transporter small permease [Rhodospirillales bacterium]|nr:TRAP transporter small permease [Rhodospirillales bacterium]
MLALWNTVERWLVGVLAGAALALAFYAMTMRYVAPRLSPDWSDEVVIFLILWAVFLAGSALVREERHVRADLVVRLLAPAQQRWIEAVNSLAALIFCALLAGWGWAATEDARLLGERTVSTLHLPMWIYYLCLPTGCALMTLRYGQRLYRLLFAHEPDAFLGRERSHE